MKKNIGKNIVSEKQKRVIHLLVDYFEKHNIKYHFTGGLAGNLFGSLWKLQDIDVEVEIKNLYKIENDFNNFILKSVHKYIDDEFEIWLLQLKIDDVEVDINAIEDFLIKPSFKVETKIENAVEIFFENRTVKTQPLEDIISYKKLLKRDRDLEELTKLCRK